MFERVKYFNVYKEYNYKNTIWKSYNTKIRPPN